MFSYPSKLWH